MTEDRATRASQAPHGPHTPPGGPGPHPAPADASQGRTAGRVVTGEEVPQDVLDAAQRGYSMHGAGLTANLIAAAWPAIEKHIRDRTPTGDLRERLREALRQAAHWCDGRCDCEFGDHKVFVVAQVDGRITEIEGTPDALADAVLHVVEAETADLRERAENAEDRLRKATDAYTRLHAEVTGTEATGVRWQKRAEEAERQRDEALAAVQRVRETAHIADAEDVTHWQRGYRSAMQRIVTALDQPKETR